MAIFPFGHLRYDTGLVDLLELGEIAMISCYKSHDSQPSREWQLKYYHMIIKRKDVKHDIPRYLANKLIIEGCRSAKLGL